MAYDFKEGQQALDRLRATTEGLREQQFTEYGPAAINAIARIIADKRLAKKKSEFTEQKTAEMDRVAKALSDVNNPNLEGPAQYGGVAEVLAGSPLYQDQGINLMAQMAMLKEKQKGEGLFGGGVEGDALNIYLNSIEDPEQRQREAIRLSRERLQKERVISTPTGEERIPGYTLPPQYPVTSGPAGGQAPIAPEPKVIERETHPEQLKYNQQWADASKVFNVLDEYNSLIRELGPQFKLGKLGSADSKRLLSAFRSAQMMLKSPAAYELGVLAGVDMQLISEAMIDPTGLEAQADPQALYDTTEETLKFLQTGMQTVNDQWKNSNFVTTNEMPSIGGAKGREVWNDTSMTFTSPKHGTVYFKTPEQYQEAKAAWEARQ